MSTRLIPFRANCVTQEQVLRRPLRGRHQDDGAFRYMLPLSPTAERFSSALPGALWYAQSNTM